MSTTIKSVLETVRGTLEDEDLTTWTLQDLIRYLNDGQRDIHVLRPDLFNSEVDHALVGGVNQALPADGSKLIDITHNTVSGVPVTRIQRALLDAQVRGWRAATASADVDHFMYDEREPTAFLVYPPAASGARVTLRYASVPTQVAIPAVDTSLDSITGNISVPDLQATALQHYICMRCYLEGGEAAHAGKAQQFQTLTAEMLGVELKSIAEIAPRNAK